MTEYRLFSEIRYDRNVGFYTTYGISVFQDGTLTRIVRDVSLDRDKVEKSVKIFNTEGLEPEHLSQVVEDFLLDDKT